MWLIVLMPTFAVGRAQMLLYLLHKLMGEGKIPKLTVFLNSLMAIKATEIFSRHHKEHRGDALVNGAEFVNIHEEYWPVKAEIYNLDSLSAHGDYEEILDWLGQGQLNPRKVLVTHGEMVASDEMRKRIRSLFGWDVEVPELFGEAGN